MSSKGPSNLYGGTKNRDSINYRWAKAFNKYTLRHHFKFHGNGFSSPAEYVYHAIKFANTVDKKHNLSFVDANGSTYKFNLITEEFIIVDKEGYIITYYIPKRYKYFFEERRKKAIKRRK